LEFPSRQLLTLVETDTPGATSTLAMAGAEYGQPEVRESGLSRFAWSSGRRGRISRLSAYLDAGGSRLFVVQTIEASPEYRTDVVKALYLQYLIARLTHQELAAFHRSTGRRWDG